VYPLVCSQIPHRFLQRFSLVLVGHFELFHHSLEVFPLIVDPHSYFLNLLLHLLMILVIIIILLFVPLSFLTCLYYCCSFSKRSSIYLLVLLVMLFLLHCLILTTTHHYSVHCSSLQLYHYLLIMNVHSFQLLKIIFIVLILISLTLHLNYIPLFPLILITPNPKQYLNVWTI